ncbi:MAG: biopolymer transporter ExbD [Bacteroidia bacterium]|nr:biopolymer transporter ExbD [Bacteroidia bacterium]
MSIQQRNKPTTEFSLASMSDLVFLLLIFFMITSSFVHQAGVKVDLPQSKSEKPSQGQNSVTISADSHFFWNDQQVDKEELPNLIREALKTEDPKKKVITLRADKKVTMEQAAFVIAHIAENKGSVVLATKK